MWLPKLRLSISRARMNGASCLAKTGRSRCPSVDTGWMGSAPGGGAHRCCGPGVLLRRIPAPAPTTTFGEFSIIDRAQQFSHVEKIGLINRQLIGAVSDFGANSGNPLRYFQLAHWDRLSSGEIRSLSVDGRLLRGQPIGSDRGACLLRHLIAGSSSPTVLAAGAARIDRTPVGTLVRYAQLIQTNALTCNYSSQCFV